MTKDRLLQMTREELADQALLWYRENQNLQENLSDIRLQLDQLKRLVFGSKSERYISDLNSDQIELFGLSPTIQESVKELVAYERKKPEKKAEPHGRSELPSHLRRVIVPVYPEGYKESDRIIGIEISEMLEYKKAEMYVIQYQRYKTVPRGSETIHIGVLPERPIDKGIPGPFLLAHILASKYIDHLPLYRIVKIFLRHDIKIADSTIDGWLAELYVMLKPLYDHIIRILVSQGFLQADETTIKVQDRSITGKTHTGYYWGYYSPESGLIAFDYQAGRAAEHPKGFLKEFKGYLQTDGYAGYNQLGKRQDITSVYCMAHARRKFETIAPNYPCVTVIMTLIQALYRVESQAREQKLDPVARLALRQAKSRPILEEIKQWLSASIISQKPKSALYQAIKYMQNRWEGLTEFTRAGHLEIDNNLLENHNRPIAVGRKNYLFAGSQEGAKRAAVFYTLVANAKNAGLNPEKYLAYVIQVINSYPQKRINELLPQNIKLPDDSS
jgi:transposase